MSLYLVFDSTQFSHASSIDINSQPLMELSPNQSGFEVCTNYVCDFSIGQIHST